MPGAGAIKAGGAYIEIGAVTAPLRAGLRAAGAMVKGFVSSVKVASRGVRTATRAMVAGFKVVAAAARRTASAIGGIASRLKGLAVTTVKRGMMALAGGLGLAVHSAVQFESAMARVNTIFRLSREGLAKMSKGVLEMAGRIGQTPLQLAAALYQVGSAGISAKVSLGFLESAVKSAKAGFTDAFTATKTLAGLLNAYSMSTDEAMRVSDILFKVVEGGMTTFEELAATIGGVAPIASAYGVSIEEIGAALATLTKANVSTDRAVTGLGAAILSFVRPSPAAVKLAKKLGVQLDLDAIKAKGFGGAVLDLVKGLKGNNEALAKLFPNKRALVAVTALAVSQNAEYKRQLDAVANASGATNSAFQEVYRTVKERLIRAYASMKASLVKIGTVLLPGTGAAAEFFAKTLGKVADWVDEHSEDIKKAFEEISNWIKKEVLPPLRSALDTFFKWLKGDSETTWEGVEKKATGAWKAVKEAWEGAKKVLQPAIDAIKAASEGDWKTAWETLRPTVTAAIDGTIEILKEKIPKFVNLGIDFLQGIADGLTGEAEGGESVMKKIGELIGTIVSTLIAAVAERADDIIAIGAAIGWEIIKGIANAMAEGLTGIIKDIRKVMKMMPGSPLAGLAGIGEAAEAFAGRAPALGADITSPISGAGGPVSPGTSPGRWAPPAGAGKAINVNILEPRSPQDTVSQIEREAARGRL